MNKPVCQIILYMCCSFALCSNLAAEKVTVGWIENVLLNDSPHFIQAKIDTGADNSSINAVNPTVYEKDGKPWVKFSLTTRLGKPIYIDKPIVKKTSVKMKDGNRQKRNVIEMDICIGSIKKLVRVNLVDRSHFKYQVLIGRSYLKPDILVDSEHKFTIDPVCQK